MRISSEIPYILQEKRIHRCSICKKESHWDVQWSWYGTIDEVEAKVCSEECKLKHIEELEKEIMTTGRKKAGL